MACLNYKPKFSSLDFYNRVIRTKMLSKPSDNVKPMEECRSKKKTGLAF